MSSEASQASLPATSGDIMVDSIDPMMETVLGSRMSFAERLDAQILARASRLLLDLEPVLGCWWDGKSRGAEWVRCTGLGEQSAFSMTDSEDPDRDSAEFHGTPFDPKGPRFAVLLLRSQDRDDLCVRFDHVAGDGWSAKEVTHMLAEVYSRLLDDPDYVPLPRTAPRPDHSDVLNALTAEQHAAAANPPSMMNTSQWKMRLRPGSGDGLVVRTLTLSSERVAALRAYAHARGGTVNDTLITALVRAVESNNPQRAGLKPAVSISADTRRFANGTNLDRLANIATTQTVRMDFRHGESFDETLRHVIEAVQPYKDTLWNVHSFSDDKPLSPRTARAIFWVVATALRVSRAGAMVTMNVGSFDEERLIFGSSSPVSAMVTGPICRYAGFPLLISYYRDALTLWTGFRERFIASELVDRHLASIDGQLVDVVGASAGPLTQAAAG
ncbi:MAG: hypothetical protein U1E26_12715 [Coriobacteriia bacterium]|nr:hypothetical protein [Coriobacteriia bacterium]